MSRPGATDAVAERLWRAAVDGDEPAAAAVVHGALAAGVPEEALLLDVLAPVQARVGAEWAADRLTVAQEHAVTAINERIVASLAHRRAVDRATAPRGRVTVGCVDGEWHAFPARLVAEVLSLHGWRVDYLGAQTPTPHLVAHLHRSDPDAVLLSGSVPTRLPAAHAAVTACRAVGVPVLAGGRAFGPDGRYAGLLRADRWAPDARGALAVLDGGMARPDASAGRQAVDDLPHLADQEYTMVVRSRHRLVRQALADLEVRFPALRTYSGLQRERTAEDVAHIVDFLSAALYVDDPELFTTFLTWTADVLRARRVPTRSLTAGLEALAGQLRDFPRATRAIERGAAALEEHAVGGEPVTGAPVPGRPAG